MHTDGVGGWLLAEVGGLGAISYFFPKPLLFLILCECLLRARKMSHSVIPSC